MRISSRFAADRPGILVFGPLLIFCFAFGFTRNAAASDIGETALQQIAALQSEKATRTAAQQKMDSQLWYALKQARGQDFAPGVTSLRLWVTNGVDGTVLVDVDADVSSGLLDAIGQLGGTVKFSSVPFKSVRAKVPLLQLETLAGRSDVKFVRAAVPAMTRTGSVDSEGDTTHRAIQARSAFGVNGAGVKVGVLSDSVDFLAQAQQTGDLPPVVTVLPGQSGVGEGEGTAMLEIVYDLAPGAQLFFATGFGSEASFAQNILDLRAAGCDIIVDDVFYFDESPFQDAVVARAVNSVTASGALYFSAAGNEGNLTHGTSGTWEGDFADGGAAGTPVNGKGGRLHSFGATAYDLVTGNGFATVLHWSDPLGFSTNDYDLYVLDTNGTTIVSSSTTVQNGFNDPFEIVPPPNPGERIVVVQANGDARFLHIDTIRGQLQINTLGNITGHPTATNAFAVAAVDVHTAYPNAFIGGAANPTETFSTDGPRRVFYNADGTAITPTNLLSTGGFVRQKPEITAADGVVTTLPFGSGLNPFYGTSAAAPHAAAIAALIKSLNPGLTQPEIRTILQTTALDIEAPGFDRDSGSGIVMADQALAATPPALLVFVGGGNGNGLIDPNECDDLTIVLTNSTSLGQTNIQAILTTTTPGILIAQGTSRYPDLPPNSSRTNISAFKISVAPTFLCGTAVTFNLAVKSDQSTRTNLFQLNTGTNGPFTRFDAGGPVDIPDGNPNGTNSSITVSGISGALRNATVSLYANHPNDSELIFQLIGPDGTSAILSANHGFFGSGYGSACSPDGARTTFDDGASNSIATSGAPFVGTFKPDQALAAFAGKSGTNINGTWKLRVSDGTPGNSGTLQCWSLSLSAATCLDGGGQCPGVELQLGMTATPAPIFVHGNITYSLVVSNLGPDTAKNTIIALPLPPSVTFISGSASQGNVSPSPGLVTINLGDMPVGATTSATVTVRADSIGTVSVSGTLSSDNPEFDPSNNSVTVASQVLPLQDDLAAGISAAPNPALVGSTVTYTVSVTNNGPSTATFVVSSNNLPPTVGIVSVNPSQGSFSVLGNTVICNFGSIPAGTRATAAINVVPGSSGTIVATSFASGSTNEVDPVTGNNFASASVVVNPAADLALTISAPASVVVRSNFAYTITATNLGPNNASGVVINHTLPPGAKLVSSNASPSGTFTFGGGVLACNVGSLPVGSGVGLAVVVFVTNTATVSSSASVSSGQADPNTSNNGATAVTLVSAPFVSIVPAGATLSAEYFTNGTPGLTNGVIDIGETVQLALALKNVGNVGATNLVTATLLTNSSVLPAQPNISSDYDVLAPGGSAATHQFTFTAAGTNGGTVTAVLRLNDGTNDLGTATFTFLLPNVARFANTNRIDIPTTLQDQQQPGPAAPYPSAVTVSGLTGLVGKVTVTLSNLNHTFPHDINLLLVGPTGAKVLLMSDDADGSSVSGTTLTFDDSAPSPLPNFGPITSGVSQPSAYDPAAAFSSPAPTGPYNFALAFFDGTDPNGTWKLFAYDDTAGDFGNIANGWSLAISTANPLYKPTDLAVLASSASASVRVGSNFTNIFTVTNSGPSKSGGIWFTNILPPGSVLISAANSASNPFITNGNSLACYLGDVLDVNATASVTLVLSPAATNSPISVSGTVVATNSAVDINQANNTASTLTTVLLPFADIAVSQTLSPNPAVLGFALTNTVLVTNAGPGPAFSVLLTNTLPSGAGLLYTIPSGSVIGGKVVLQLGDIAANTAVAALIVVTNTDQTSKTNISSVSTVSLDSNTANNTAISVVSVVPPVLQLGAGSAVLLSESGPKNGFIDIGETNTVDLYLLNVGNIPSTNIVATLLAANGVLLNSGPQIQTYGSLGAGASGHRPFTFTAGPGNGGNVLATVSLQDGSFVTNITFSLLARSFFTNSTGISIPDHGVAGLYPSTINVSGLGGVVSKASVSLFGVGHTFPRDINALLGSPGNADVLLMSHAGGAYSLANVNLTFSDSSGALLASNSQITSGTYQPTAYSPGVTLPFPVPAAPYGSALSALAGGSPNGDWDLYIFDDTPGDAGNVAGGWSLDLTTTPVIAPPVLSASLNAGQFQLSISAQAGTYVIYGSTDFANWTPLSTNVSTGSSITFTDPAFQSLGARYYRALRLLP